MRRRSFLGLPLLLAGIENALASTESISKEDHRGRWGGVDFSWTHGLLPLFCTAYIDPTVPSQAGQERTVAKYPIAMVSQSMDVWSRKWRRDVYRYNPQIKLLGYQVVIEEGVIPGPGHDRLRHVQDSWVNYPGGIVPTVENAPGRRARIYDPRSASWERAFIEACEAVLSADRFAGLFLDQCTIYDLASPFPSVRAEMREALGRALWKLRARNPEAIIIGNTSFDFAALNGEFNEGRPQDLAKETAFRGNSYPQYNFYQFLTPDPIRSTAQIETMAHLAFRNRCFFGVTSTYQRVYWPHLFSEFD